MPSTEEYVAAGLYDPENTADHGRLELLDWLVEMGFTVDEMVLAESAGSLSAIANDRRTLPGERLSRSQAIQTSGMATENFDAFLRAVGLTQIGGAPPGEIGVTQAEIEALASFDLLGEVFSRGRDACLSARHRLGSEPDWGGGRFAVPHRCRG